MVSISVIFWFTASAAARPGCPWSRRARPRRSRCCRLGVERALRVLERAGGLPETVRAERDHLAVLGELHVAGQGQRRGVGAEGGEVRGRPCSSRFARAAPAVRAAAAARGRAAAAPPTRRGAARRRHGSIHSLPPGGGAPPPPVQPCRPRCAGLPLPPRRRAPPCTRAARAAVDARAAGRRVTRPGRCRRHPRSLRRTPPPPVPPRRLFRHRRLHPTGFSWRCCTRLSASNAASASGFSQRRESATSTGPPIICPWDPRSPSTSRFQRHDPAQRREHLCDAGSWRRPRPRRQ